MKRNLEKTITTNCDLIASGRIGMMTEGKAEAGREAYVIGIQDSISLFKEISALRDPLLIIQSEHLFVQQQIKALDKSEKLQLASLNNANIELIDAKRSLAVAYIPEQYIIADKTHSHKKDNLTKSVPKDAFHGACSSHKTRLKNLLKSDVSLIEKELIKVRASNMDTAKSVYIELQQKALGIDTEQAANSNKKER